MTYNLLTSKLVHVTWAAFMQTVGFLQIYVLKLQAGTRQTDNGRATQK